jgi:hypothetical protein
LVFCPEGRAGKDKKPEIKKRHEASKKMREKARELGQEWQRIADQEEAESAAKRPRVGQQDEPEPPKEKGEEEGEGVAAGAEASLPALLEAGIRILSGTSGYCRGISSAACCTS